ncbi:MAG TPA: Asp23/Gls24 family envelope stress response protein [Candidatus Limnocylindrales bacterium]|nr:Asp23/Gls24 family envelope stress response protein [Candidatus Limnocylindrales bacterium]
MPEQAIGGRALVTRRAVIDIVRRVTLGSYGVAGFAGNWADRLLGWIEQRPGGLRVSVAGGTLTIRLHLRVAHGLPVAEVARQVDHAVRHAIRAALGREVDKLTIRVARLELHPGGEPPEPPARPGLGPSDLADSGTDVF